VNTHRAIDREAIDQASNLEAFVSATGIGSENYTNEKFEDYENFTYIGYIVNGEKNGITKLKQTFNDKIEYLDLLEAGTILEDAQWPHWLDGGDYNFPDMAHGRFLNHFYNPYTINKG
jgi:hypothetical protein